MDPADPADSEPRKRQRSDVPEQEQAALDAVASAVSSAESQTLAELRTETFVDGFRVSQSPGQGQPPRNSPRNSPRPGNSPALSANMVALTVDMAAATAEPAHNNPSQQTPGSAASSTRKNPPRDARQIELSAAIEDISSRHLQLISQRQPPQGASQPLDAAGSATAPTIIPNLSSGQQQPADQGSPSNTLLSQTASTELASHQLSGGPAVLNRQSEQPAQASQAAGAPGSGSTSQHGQEQPPASNAGPSGGESSRGAPSQSGAADGGASDSLPADTTAQPREAQVVKQDSGTDVTFGEGKLQKQKPKQYAVVITDRPDHELESVVHERLHDHPKWKDSFAAGFYLAIGRMIGKGGRGTVRAALIRGVPAVAKQITLEDMCAFVTERSNYTRVEKLQGRSIAWLHDTCVYSVDTSVLVIERGEVLAPVRDIYDQFINPREALDKLTDDSKKLAVAALDEIHSIGALHGDVHLGNVGFTVTNGRPRAFWFDLEHMTFPTKNLEEKQKKEKQEFVRNWDNTVADLLAALE
ncbi:hypothetical protein HK105_207234 [Polyrhizophydium stewartii]|uniref:Protein kinase domain-containing protein n=1 Tax=Polyrhizophydium stewartii TaxID=2732419 RepID=A0ABR4N139_9FUNG